MARINIKEFESIIWERDWATDHNKRSADQAFSDYMDTYQISDEQYWDVWYKMYQRMAREGNPYAMTQLGELEFLLEKSPRAGYEWLMRAASAGIPKAMRLLGDGYSEDNNDPSFPQMCHFGVNPSLCFEWTMKAAQLNDLDAIYQVAMNFALGKDGFPENPTAQKYWIERGLSLGSAKCTNYYATVFCLDPAQKLAYYEKVMTMGNASAYEQAARSLSRIYCGSDVSTRRLYNPKMAAKCYLLYWFSDSSADESDLDPLRQIPYDVTESDWNRWAAEARQLIYRRE